MAWLDGTSTARTQQQQESILRADPVTVVSASGSALTLGSPLAQKVQDVTLSANCTITLPTATAGQSFVLVLRQDATGGRAVTWPSMKWPGGSAPILTTTASAVDVISLVCSDGTNWIGLPAGYDIR